MSTGLGKRIKQRRTELELSQDTLAKRMGLKNKSSVCKVENGDDNLTTDKIRQYAEALQTTPAYLMGWEESNTDYVVFPENIVIERGNRDTEQAIKLYEAYLKAIPEVQEAVENLLKSHLSDS